MKNVILPLYEEIRKRLAMQHPEEKQAYKEILVNDIVWKTFIRSNNEIIRSVGLDQVCAGHACDSAVHVMHRRNQNPVKPLTWIALQNVPCYIFD